MEAVSFISGARSAPVLPGRIRPPIMGELENVRRIARRLRLHPGPGTSPLANLLARLPDVLGRRMVFYEAGARDVSFDEAWLLNLLDAARRADEDRYRFALLSRMPRERASALHFAVVQAARALE